MKVKPKKGGYLALTTPTVSLIITSEGTDVTEEEYDKYLKDLVVPVKKKKKSKTLVETEREKPKKREKKKYKTGG